MVRRQNLLHFLKMLAVPSRSVLAACFPHCLCSQLLVTGETISRSVKRAKAYLVGLGRQHSQQIRDRRSRWLLSALRYFPSANRQMRCATTDAVAAKVGCCCGVGAKAIYPSIRSTRNTTAYEPIARKDPEENHHTHPDCLDNAEEKPFPAGEASQWYFLTLAGGSSRG